MRKCCGREKISLEFMTDLHIFSTPEYENVIFGNLSVCRSVCMYVCMYMYVL
jgi:hypothetical protein